MRQRTVSTLQNFLRVTSTFTHISVNCCTQTIRQLSLTTWSQKLSAQFSYNGIRSYTLHSLRRCSTVTSHHNSMTSSVDKYNGVHLDVGQVSIDMPPSQFGCMLKECLALWQKEGRNSVLMKVPILHSHLIPAAAKLDFEFHHSHEDYSVLKLWLQSERPDLLPIYATHQVGVSGFVLNEDTREVLVIQDHHRRYTTWKFPGGLSDLGEDIAVTAEREVFEETGIETEFQSILTFRQQHQHPNAFGRSDIYIVCRLKPLTFDLKPCSHEVKECQWMPLNEVIEHKEIAILTKRVTKLMMYGLEEGFDKIDINFEEFPAVYSGLFYKLYHRTLPDKWR